MRDEGDLQIEVVFTPGHGLATTVGEEKRNNLFSPQAVGISKYIENKLKALLSVSGGSPVFKKGMAL